jgi:hypothetical protein
MDALGTQYLQDLQSHACLYFSHTAERHTFLRFEGASQSWLRFFFMALPSFVATHEFVQWNDALPGNIMVRRKGFSSFVQSFAPAFFSSRGQWQLSAPGTITGEIHTQSPWSSHVVQTECRLASHRSPASLLAKFPKHQYELRLIHA